MARADGSLGISAWRWSESQGALVLSIQKLCLRSAGVVFREPTTSSNKVSRALSAAVLKDGKVDRVGHGFITEVVWMQVIAAVKLWREACRVSRVARGSLEVYDRIELAAVSNEIVGSLPLCLAFRRCIAGALKWGERRADDLDALCVCPRNQLTERLDDLVRCNALVGEWRWRIRHRDRRKADIVDTQEHGHKFDVGLTDHIAVKA